MSKINSGITLEAFAEACNYPGEVDVEHVNVALMEYLRALGMSREVVRLERGWELCDHSALRKSVIETLRKVSGGDALDARDARNARAALDARDALDAIAALDARAARDAIAARDARAALAARDALDAFAARDARDALDARAARDARDARAARDALDARAALAARDALENDWGLRRFSQWCVQWCVGWYYRDWDLSWISCTFFGAKQLKTTDVLAWSQPLCQAFIAGCWMLYWTPTTLFWIAKPRLHRDSQRRLHHDSGAAFESDGANGYYWHGVEVPAFVVVRPDSITIKHIDAESNAEVRRVMIERYGQARYIVDAGAKEIHRDDFGVLYRRELPNDEPLVMVKVVNSTPEPDGTFKDYWLRVPPQIQRAREAVAWTFDKSEEHYNPEFQT